MTKIEYDQPEFDAARAPSCAVAYFNSVLDTGVSLGIERSAMIDRINVDAADLAAPNDRVPMDTLIDLLKLGAELTAKPDFGLHVGPNLRAGSFGILGYLSLCSRDVREASELMLKFKRLVFDAGYTEMHEDGDITVYTWQPLKPEFLENRYLVDAIFSGWVCFSGRTTGKINLAKKVELSYPEPMDSSFHRELFGCEVSFGCDENRMYVPTETLSQPSHQANEAIFSSLNDQAHNFLSKLNSEASVVGAVRYHLFRLLPKGDASIDTVAELLLMNRRKLQRKLSSEGANFRAVLNTLRTELVEQYFQNKDYSMLDIALLVGFSDSSAFTSWFKSLRKMTPTEYRDNILTKK